MSRSLTIDLTFAFLDDESMRNETAAGQTSARWRRARPGLLAGGARGPGTLHRGGGPLTALWVLGPGLAPLVAGPAGPAGLQAQPVPQQACGPGPARNGLAGPACTAAGSLARSGLNCGYRAYWPGPLRGRRTGSAQSSALIRVRPAPLRTVTSWPALAMPAHQYARGLGSPRSGTSGLGPARPVVGLSGPGCPALQRVAVRPKHSTGLMAWQARPAAGLAARPAQQGESWPGLTGGGHIGPARPAPLTAYKPGPAFSSAGLWAHPGP
ncbi:uncharacterized protein LOC109717131 [Ananas comosus]|uniref:Uncharacterized protein LOC109717131 n=1 Tax=Ananas comosus TaxID=4615 RepID=A0A6P5FR09_ANACO|nr:uncharacterized protein LOC109717131 [Ananas comosus]